MNRLLITGAGGQLGSYLLHQIASSGRDVQAWTGSTKGERAGIPLSVVDLTDDTALQAAFKALSPTIVLHAAAQANANECYRNPERAYRVNTHATAVLAELCANIGARMVFVSTDLVFDGENAPYREDDPAMPLLVYGQTKRDAEQAVLARTGNAVARVSLLYGPTLAGRPSFFDQQLAALRESKPITLFHDEWRTPLDLPTAAKALLALADSDASGLFHIGGPERMSRLEMGQRLAKAMGLNADVIQSRSRLEVNTPEPRPCDTSLDSSRWRSVFGNVEWPGYEEALGRM